MMRFGCGHVTVDPEVHEASWGARLIYAEVKAGASGVVYDRQTPEGEPESVRLTFPVVERATAEARRLMSSWQMEADSRGRLCWRDGRVLVVMSPQGSYGYLYVTAVLERPDKVGQTKLRAFEDGEVPAWGNWPPEIVAAREEKRRKDEREWALARVVSAERDLDWEQRDLWSAQARGRTARFIKSRQNRVDKAEQDLLGARRAAAEAGITDEEVKAKRQRWF